MTALGVAITLLIVLILAVEFVRYRRARLAAYGWIGLIGLIAAEWLMFHHFRPVSVYFTPIAWTCYILLADSAVLSISGRSLLHDEPANFVCVAILSIPLWLIFEAYNLRLHNWTYSGVPQSWPLMLLGYDWSFATIAPGIFETADLIESFGWFPSATPIRFSSAVHRSMMQWFPGCAYGTWRGHDFLGCSVS